jgi:hypothetical protein
MIHEDPDDMAPGGVPVTSVPPSNPAARGRFTDATNINHVRLSVGFTKKLYDDIVEYAKKEELSIVSFIRRAVRRDIERRR